MADARREARHDFHTIHNPFPWTTHKILWHSLLYMKNRGSFRQDAWLLPMQAGAALGCERRGEWRSLTSDGALSRLAPECRLSGRNSSDAGFNNLDYAAQNLKPAGLGPALVLDAMQNNRPRSCKKTTTGGISYYVSEAQWARDGLC